MVKGIGRRGIDTLLAFHGSLHDGMMSLQGIHVVLVVGKDLLLDALAEAIVRNESNDLGGVLLLGVDPANHLINVLGRTRGVKLVGLDHGLADGCSGLLNLRNDGRVVKNSAWNLTMATSKTEDEVKSGLLLDIVIGEGTAVFELLAGEDETLLVGGDALLVLDLGFDVVNGVGGLDVKGDGLARQGLDKDLCGGKSGHMYVTEVRNYSTSIFTHTQHMCSIADPIKGIDIFWQK